MEGFCSCIAGVVAQLICSHTHRLVLSNSAPRHRRGSPFVHRAVLFVEPPAGGTLVRAASPDLHSGMTMKYVFSQLLLTASTNFGPRQGADILVTVMLTISIAELTILDHLCLLRDGWHTDMTGSFCICGVRQVSLVSLRLLCLYPFLDRLCKLFLLDC